VGVSSRLVSCESVVGRAICVYCEALHLLVPPVNFVECAILSKCVILAESVVLGVWGGFEVSSAWLPGCSSREAQGVRDVWYTRWQRGQKAKA
jgi:hypothetical protein